MKRFALIAVASLAVAGMLAGVVAAQPAGRNYTYRGVFPAAQADVDVPPPEPDEAYEGEAIATDRGDAWSCGRAPYYGASDGGCQPGWGLSDCCYGPCWTFTGGALIMDRTGPDDAVLVPDPQLPDGPGLMNAGDFDFDWRGGWEVGAIRHNVRSSGWDLEGRYFRIDGWRAAWGVVETPVGFLSGTYDSHLDGAEVNLRRPVCGGWLTLLGGFRFVELDEAVSVLVDSRLGVARARATAVNDLYGFQLGADGRVWDGCWLAVDAKVRAGVYGNEVATTVATYEPGAFNLGARGEDNHTAFFGEVGLTGAVRLADCLALRAGYQLMWLEGVALAPDQFAVADPTTGLATVDTSGSPFYHGAVISLEYTR